jgi:hypothetical protein
MRSQVWRDLINALQRGNLSHRDIVVAALVSYFWKRKGGEEGLSVIVEKKEVKPRTRLPVKTFVASLVNLQNVMWGLLSFKERCRQIDFAGWAGDLKGIAENDGVCKPDGEE